MNTLSLLRGDFQKPSVFNALRGVKIKFYHLKSDKTILQL